jgi:hypothetical protein
LDSVGPDIFWSIFHSKESILFAGPRERVRTSLQYVNILWISVLYSVTQTLKLMPWLLIGGRIENKPFCLPVFSYVFLLEVLIQQTWFHTFPLICKLTAYKSEIKNYLCETPDV